MIRDHGDEPAIISGYEVMKRLLALQPRPDGVFCYNDPSALSAMKAVFDAGLDVPKMSPWWEAAT